MKRRLLCLLLLLFALFAVIIVVPRALDGTLPTKPGPGSDITETIIPPTETMENIVSLDVPLVAEVSRGKDWDAAH